MIAYIISDVCHCGNKEENQVFTRKKIIFFVLSVEKKIIPIIKCFFGWQPRDSGFFMAVEGSYVLQVVDTDFWLFWFKPLVFFDIGLSGVIHDLWNYDLKLMISGSELPH